MCSYGQGVWEKGLEQGFAKGMDLGKAEGMAEGIEKGMDLGIAKGRDLGMAEGTLAAIKALMSNMGWSAEQTMQNMQIPEAERAAYFKRLN